MCDVCGNESGGKDVGVAAVPMAPVSVMWCDNCLRENAVPKFVLETWLFSEFDQYELEMPAEPLEFPLGELGDHMKVWMDGKYSTLREVFPQLWQEEYERIQNVEAQ
jgi:hypothetical protein